ncbi:ATP-binding protein, partial [Candidatus Micrarchaeota archaeon]|nr:ATP-binding protein [Candidatus Micrarchaeota archaeon]
MLKEKLAEVIAFQRKELFLSEKTVPREDLDSIKPMASFAIAVSGIRRCGKSTLLRQLLKREK